MRRDPETWAGVAMLLLAVGVGGPVLVGAVDPTIPRAWWTTAFVLTIGGVLVASTAEQRVRLGHTALAVAVLGSWAVVLGAPGMGFLSILLVLIAALSVYVSRLAVTLVIVALNTAVLVLAGSVHGSAWAEVAVGTAIYLVIHLAAVLSSVAILREQALRRRLTEAHTELRATSALLAESARTAERLRISRDLHDAIGHQLTVLSLELEAARHREGDRAREHVERAHGVARALLGDVRATVGQLRTAPTDLGETLRGIVDGLPGLDVSVEVAPGVRPGEDVSTAVIRAVQEILTNTIRHARATELWIEIRDADGATVLTAADDGRGAPDPVLGNGLSGLVERFEALGGSVDLDGRKGFTVTARVPAA